MALTTPVSGETVVGTSLVPSTLAINSNGASGLVLLDSAGTEYVVWVKTTGELFIGTRAQFATPDAAGTKVGGQ